MNIFSSLIQFIMMTTQSNKIDESHGIMHSFNTLHYAHNIYQAEHLTYPEIIPHERIIYISSAVHDMCDKKYMNEEESAIKIDEFLNPEMTKNEITAVHDIITKMSYSKVIKNGFPDLGKYQRAYHVVREADLLCAYDFDRAMIYHLYNKKNDVEGAYDESVDLFHKRMFNHEKDNLFTYNYSKQQAALLKQQSVLRMKHWKQIIRSFK
tara:strand:+ start:118 stop:744 length:627 start_codon:yes stop_codon:yes gene_type:complete